MSYYYDKTPVLDTGLARRVLVFILLQVKSNRGTTTFLEHHGINGRWLKPEVPYDIRISKFLKIIEIKALFQTDDDFLDDWQKIGEYILRLVRHHSHSKYNQ